MKTETIGKTPELCLPVNDGLLFAKHPKEKHHELLWSLRQQYSKPTKPVKNARKAWKDKGESFSEALLKMRAE